MPDTAKPDLPLNRAGDQGRSGRIREFWHQWGQFITGAWLILMSGLLLVVAVSFYVSQSNTEENARVACQRSLVFGPALARAYDRYDILTDAELAEYRKTIPKACP